MRFPTIHTSLKSFAGHALAGTVGVAALTLILSAAPAAHAQDNIDTLTTWNGTDTYQNQGPSYTPTYGQTITAPADGETLTSFTFDGANSGAAFNEVAEVVAYTGTYDPSATPLYSSQITIGANSGLTDYTISTGYLGLASGTTYALLFTTVGATGNTNVASSDATFAADYASQYSGGNFIYDQSTATGSAYENFGGADMAFKATFAPAAATPEPGMVVTGLSMLSMTGLGLVRGRRRAKAAAKLA